MPTHGTQCWGIRDDQDEILVSQQSVCRGERQPPTPVSCKRKSKFGDGDADRATGTWKGASPAGLAGLREGFPDGDSREAAVTVAKSKGVIKDTEPQSCIHRAPASPRSTDKRKGAASPDLAGPDSTVRRGDLAGGAVTAVSPAPQRLLLQTWHSTNTC